MKIGGFNDNRTKYLTIINANMLNSLSIVMIQDCIFVVLMRYVTKFNYYH